MRHSRNARARTAAKTAVQETNKVSMPLYAGFLVMLLMGCTLAHLLQQLPLHG